VPRFARRVHELDPASANPGNAATQEQLRAVSAALLTVGDAMVRAPDLSPGRGVGLRGGTFAVREVHGGYRLLLRGLHWTEDLEVSGTVDFPRYQGPAHATLRLHGGSGLDGTLDAQWPEGVALARAQVHGVLGGRRLVAEAPAP
jgi:hypothetical protein